MVINYYPSGIVNHNDETFTIKRVLRALNKLNPTFSLPFIHFSQKDNGISEYNLVELITIFMMMPKRKTMAQRLIE